MESNYYIIQHFFAKFNSEWRIYCTFSSKIEGNKKKPPIQVVKEWPGNVLLLHVCTTLGAKELNFCVRDGNRCGLFAIVTGLGSFFFAGISFDLPKPDTFYHTLESIQVRKLLPMRACSPF